MSGGMAPGRRGRGAQPETVPRGVEPLGAVVARVVKRVSGAGARAAEQIEAAWKEVVSDRVWAHTRPVGIRRGVVTIEVDNSVLLQELAAFEKALLVEGLRARVNRVYVEDLRFRLGRARSAQA